MKSLQFTVLVSLAGLASLGACGSVGSTDAQQAPSTQAGQLGAKPGGDLFIADPNRHGNGQEVRIVRVAFGRMVRVFGLDAFGARVPVFNDFVIDPVISSDGQNYELSRNPVTGEEQLVILRDFSDSGGGRTEFFQLLKDAEVGLTPIHAAHLGDSGIHSMVPRNAAVVIQFDDLIDASTIDATTVRLLAGDPPVLPFEARVFVDPHHGDLADHDGQLGAEFYSTRLIIDPTITEVEASSLGSSLPINGTGFPGAGDVSLANILVRIPTRVAENVGQLQVLRNPSGHRLAASGNGPVDDASSSVDLVRAMRAGGRHSVTGDPFNGFLPDQEPPTLVGSMNVELLEAPVITSDEAIFRLPRIRFETQGCIVTPKVGDVVRQGGLLAEVINQSAHPVGNEVHDVMVRVLAHPFPSPVDWASGGVGPARILTAYDPDVHDPRCFIEVTPEGVGSLPTTNVSTLANFSLHFSEPMDPESLTAFDSVMLTRSPLPETGNLPTSEFVIGDLQQASDLRGVTYLPDLPLAHEQGVSESYYLNLIGGEGGPTDLAGNPIVLELPPVQVAIDSAEPTERNNGRVTRFTGVDEEPPFGTPENGPLPEWAGQLFYDLARESIRARPVIHFTGVIDRNQPVINEMNELPGGIQTPLSGFGSRTQALWRYCDFGWSMTDASFHNIDVEGLYWTPALGEVLAEVFSEFSIKLGHAKYLPDEFPAASSALPDKEDSGLTGTFDSNWLHKPETRVVHERHLGYAIDPGELQIHPANGTRIMPYSWNRGVAPEDRTTWTWRNTSIRKRAGKFGSGAPIRMEFLVAGGDEPTNHAQGIYRPEHVRAEAMPMMMEFRCYPDSAAFGLNAFDIQFAVNNSIQPYFRAFSTGGVIPSGADLVHPDAEEEANGGHDPTSDPVGEPTPGLDNTVYMGAADFVTRISRVHSVWFPAIDPSSPNGDPFDAPIYRTPIFEPRLVDQPDGTKIKLSFRGGDANLDLVRCCPEPDQIPNLDPFTNALTLDPFGDYYDDTCVTPDMLPVHNTPQENRGCNTTGNLNPIVEFLNDDNKWLPTISSIDGAKYYQVRITFESNIHTGLTPELSALAIGWHE